MLVSLREWVSEPIHGEGRALLVFAAILKL